MTLAAPARDLDGKVAVVAGGSRNMGAEFATRLAARGAATVISYSGDEAAAQKTLARLGEHGATAQAVRADATDPAQTEALFSGVVERHGRLDIVVHLPGMVLKKPPARCTDDDYDQVIDRNRTGCSPRRTGWGCRATSGRWSGSRSADAGWVNGQTLRVNGALY
ncbi:MAG TPA: SDR family NAD(P)-dependent oxidoreductase [Pseudonocardia sp.]|jgi:3-oxoacyl-[acyl-carrier protein] reductase|uniref:SDR family NAD(P)-dependent oxidoreductase n=1 Tax=Pseudonocardia sp. TaxID=60912 RepID=UPI002B4B7DC1|nr:SDR family NAD(P)-dependent oxidoreductase [Pseudonocardia sp.]HLU54947.1 SDR family NAD(P)-dependent oxidoreductase [Pseudonocardia sp.]